MLLMLCLVFKNSHKASSVVPIQKKLWNSLVLLCVEVQDILMDTWMLRGVANVNNDINNTETVQNTFLKLSFFNCYINIIPDIPWIKISVQVS